MTSARNGWCRLEHTGTLREDLMAQLEPELREEHCLSCAIVAGRTATVGGVILETPHFHAHQDYKYPIPGFVILATKRHVRCMDELMLAA
jgi:hypothetical protein